MNIQTTLKLDKQEEKILREILQCQDDAEFAEKLNTVAAAAVEEYCRMILGQKVFNRATDLREYRLLLLIKTLYHNTIPNEQAVSALFQTTPAESKTLIRSTTSKYKYELKEAVAETLKDIIAEAEPADEKDNKHRVVIKSATQVDELNRILLLKDGTLPKIKKDAGSVSQYIIEASSYEALCEYLG
jgi:hypothetical protein